MQFVILYYTLLLLQVPASPSGVVLSTSSLPHQSSSPSLSQLQRILPLKPHATRWFYEESGKAWTPFNGHNSLCLEDCYQKLQKNRSSSEGCEVSVLGDMYEANILEKLCKPIYWTGIYNMYIHVLYILHNVAANYHMMVMSNSVVDEILQTQTQAPSLLSPSLR